MGCHAGATIAGSPIEMQADAYHASGIGILKRMSRAARTWAKTLLVCLLFLALGVTQAASLVHRHEEGSHCCDLCHSGHTPVVATPLVREASLPEATERRQTPASESRVLTGSASHKSSRAPPVSQA